MSARSDIATGRWLRVTGEDDRQHVVYLLEFNQHRLCLSCDCLPAVHKGVVIHTIITPDVTVAPYEQTH